MASSSGTTFHSRRLLHQINGANLGAFSKWVTVGIAINDKEVCQQIKSSLQLRQSKIHFQKKEPIVKTMDEKFFKSGN